MEYVRDKRVKDAFMNSTLQSMILRGELRKDHPLQRKPDQWNKSDKDGFIATVIKWEDVDSIKICEQLTPKGVILWVIDGIQRITTLSSYRNGVFKLGSSLEVPITVYQTTQKDEKGRLLQDEYGNYTYENVEYDLRGKGYQDLPVELKEKFDNYRMDYVKHLNCTDEEIGYHIRRYNKQKSMNASQSTVTFMDHVAQYVKHISQNSRFFKDCGTYTEKERSNGTIERIIIETVMCMYHLDHWKKQSRQMGEYLNRYSGKQEFDCFHENLQRLEQIVTADLSDIFTSKDSFIWFTVFHKFRFFGLENRRFADFLTTFKHDRLGDVNVDGASFYLVDKSGSTKDKAIIVRKLSVLETLMKQYLGMQHAVPEKPDLIQFVKKQVKEDVTLEDMEQYEEVLSDLTLNVDNSSELLNRENRPSLMALVAYSFEQDLDLDRWIVQYFKNTKLYIRDQKKNYLVMIDNLKQYLNHCAS